MQTGTSTLFEQAGAECPRGPECLKEPHPGQQQPDPAEQGQIFT